jgi:folate-binding protein YgfZ
MNEPRLLKGVRAVETGLAAIESFEVPLYSLGGSDHRETLQRLVTQDVLALRPGEGRLSLLLAPKGQFRALMAVFARSGDLLLAAPPGWGEELAALLGKYLALSRSRLEPMAARSLVIAGPRWPEAAEAAGVAAGSLEAGGWAVGAGSEPLWLAGSLLGSAAAVAVARTDEALVPLRAVLEGLGATSAGAEALELARIRAGRPAWGRELTAAVLPPEAGIGEEAISHTKGCYVGQETMARLRTYGRLNRGLVGVLQEGGPARCPEVPLPLSLGDSERPVGELTSCGWHPQRGGIGLAVVRTRAVAPGNILAAGDRAYRVTALPLW